VAERPARQYTLEVRGQPLGINQTRGLHWTRVARDRTVYRDAFALLAKQEHSGPPFERAHVSVTLVRRRGQSPLDPDNVYSRAKGPILGLVDAGVLAEESSAYCDVQVHQEQGKERAIRVEVCELL
jgi:hypothetical protein